MFNIFISPSLTPVSTKHTQDEEGDLVAITSEEEWEEGVQVLSSVAASSEQQAGPLLHLMAIPKHQIMDVACGRLSLPLAPAPQVVHEKKQEEKKEEEKEEPAEEVVEEHECSTSRCEMVRVVLGLPVPTKEGFIEVIRRSRKPLILSVDAQNLSALCGRVYCDRVLVRPCLHSFVCLFGVPSPSKSSLC